MPPAQETAHAGIHFVIENHIAMGVEPVGETVARLVAEGLDRHEAIHAIGAVLAEEMFELSRSDEKSWNKGRYQKRLNKLTAKRWR